MSIFKGLFGGAAELVTGISLRGWIIGGLVTLVVAAIGFHFIQVRNLRADVATAEAATTAKQGELDTMTANRDNLQLSLTLQNAAVVGFAGKCQGDAVSASLLASNALLTGEAERRADEADPTAGPARMNQFLKQNFGG